jgi:hypothetical protein
MSIQNFIKICVVVLELNHDLRWMDGQTDLVSPKCVHFVHIVQGMHNKEELPEQWKESVIVPIYKMGENTDCSNYEGIFSILMSRLTPCSQNYWGSSVRILV